jgi:hypothetical protein
MPLDTETESDDDGGGGVGRGGMVGVDEIGPVDGESLAMLPARMPLPALDFPVI